MGPRCSYMYTFPNAMCFLPNKAVRLQLGRKKSIGTDLEFYVIMFTLWLITVLI